MGTHLLCHLHGDPPCLLGTLPKEEAQQAPQDWVAHGGTHSLGPPLLLPPFLLQPQPLWKPMELPVAETPINQPPTQCLASVPFVQVLRGTRKTSQATAMLINTSAAWNLACKAVLFTVESFLVQPPSLLWADSTPHSYRLNPPPMCIVGWGIPCCVFSIKNTSFIFSCPKSVLASWSLMAPFICNDILWCYELKPWLFFINMLWHHVLWQNNSSF